MSNKEIRASAKEYVSGRRGEVWCALFALMSVSIIFGIIQSLPMIVLGEQARGIVMVISLILSLLSVIVTIILQPGFITCVVNIWYGDENGGFTDIFRSIVPFDRIASDRAYYMSVLNCMILLVIKIALRCLIPIVGVFIAMVKAIECAPVIYLISDGLDDINHDLFTKSKAIMNGYRVSLVKMYFSYCLWAFIPLVGPFIALYKLPEFQVAIAGFIEDKIDRWDGEY